MSNVQRDQGLRSVKSQLRRRIRAKNVYAPEGNQVSGRFEIDKTQFHGVFS
jgi:hypothetical protein